MPDTHAMGNGGHDLSDGAMTWTALPLAWLDRGPRDTPMNGDLRLVETPTAAWDYGDVSEVIDSPDSLRLLRVEVEVLSGRVGLSLMAPNGAGLLTEEAVLLEGEGPRSIYLRQGPEMGPARLLFRNHDAPGQAGRLRLRALAIGALEDAPPGAVVLAASRPAAPPGLDGDLAWVAQADQPLTPISLGNSCETKFQIARILHERRTGRAAGAAFRLQMLPPDRGRDQVGWDVFDWQGTPMAALLALLDNDFDGAFERADLEPCGEDVAHRRLRTTHLHEFDSALPADRKAFTVAEIDRNYAEARAAFDARAAAFRRHLLQPGPFLYVHACEDMPGPWTVLKLIDRLRARSDQHRFRILFVGHPDTDTDLSSLSDAVDKALPPVDGAKAARPHLGRRRRGLERGARALWAPLSGRLPRSGSPVCGGRAAIVNFGAPAKGAAQELRLPQSLDEDDVRRRIAGLLGGLLSRPDLEVTAATRASEVAGWDSLAHLRLLSALEEEYGVIFGVDEIEEPADVGELAALVVQLSRPPR